MRNTLQKQIKKSTVCLICGRQKTHHRLYGYRCNNPEHQAMEDAIGEQIADRYFADVKKEKSKKILNVWGLLKAYVKEFEIANNVQFSDAAWQRIKQLEQDIYEVMRGE